ncbi:hypothetical protein H0H92_012920, partial [Tricholoma furcatifolium]
PEVYSKLFYESKLKPLVESQLDSTLSRGSLLAARNQIIKQLWEAETDPDVKAQVEAHFDEPKPSAETTPSHQSSDKYAQVLEGLAKKTGWYYTVLMGGPNPGENGNISVASLHVGENSNGASFSQAHTNFERNYMEPYAQFLTSAFTRAIRGLPMTGGITKLGDEQEERNVNPSTVLAAPTNASSTPATPVEATPSSLGASPSPGSSSLPSPLQSLIIPSSADATLKSVSPPIASSSAAAEPLPMPGAFV